ncbi:MAG: HAD family phosphatase [Gammaproteobacteria bacterium]|nr:HAD family phosphatase [Gammaproteobacteria bacterium]
MTLSRNISALLFDLGGVIIDIDFTRALQSWNKCSRLSIEEIERRFKMDDAFQRHERGEIECHEYFTHLRLTLEIEASDDEIAQGWNAIFIDEITATVDYIAAIRTELPCYAFTNSNPTHQDFWMATFPTAINAFEQIFVSSEMGLRKPEREAFEAISATTGKRLDEILFFDDTEENVVGARAAGMPAVLVNSHADVEQALAEIDAF